MSRKDKGWVLRFSSRPSADFDISVEKFRRILSRYGYRYENKMVLLTDGNGTPVCETSEKPTPIKKKAKAKAALRSKKRKLDSAMAEENIEVGEENEKRAGLEEETK